MGPEGTSQLGDQNNNINKAAKCFQVIILFFAVFILEGKGPGVGWGYIITPSQLTDHFIPLETTHYCIQIL